MGLATMTNFYFRVCSCLDYRLFWAAWLGLIVSMPVQSRSIQLEQSGFRLHESIAIFFSGAESSDDWIGIYRSGQVERGCGENKNYLAREPTYVTGDGLVEFFGLDKVGEYQVQMFRGGSYCPVDSAPLTIWVHDD